MERKRWLVPLITALLMVALPWLTVTLVQGASGMAICFLLFFAINPLYACLIGIWAGHFVRTRWLYPVLTAGFYLLGAWLWFDMGEVAFILYAGIYLLIGMIAMWIGHRLHKRRRKSMDV